MRTDTESEVKIVNGTEAHQAIGVEGTADKTIAHLAETGIYSRTGVEATGEAVEEEMRILDTKTLDKRSERAPHHHPSPKSLHLI